MRCSAPRQNSTCWVLSQDLINLEINEDLQLPLRHASTACCMIMRREGSASSFIYNTGESDCYHASPVTRSREQRHEQTPTWSSYSKLLTSHISSRACYNATLHAPQSDERRRHRNAHGRLQDTPSQRGSRFILSYIAYLETTCHPHEDT